jgi:hypothetical protein
MPQHISTGKIVTVTKEGEVHLSITLDLNINLKADGQFGVTTLAAEAVEKPKEIEKDSFEYEIPDFSSGFKVDFGK